MSERTFFTLDPTTKILLDAEMDKSIPLASLENINLGCLLTYNISCHWRGHKKDCPWVRLPAGNWDGESIERGWAGLAAADSSSSRKREVGGTEFEGAAKQNEGYEHGTPDFVCCRGLERDCVQDEAHGVNGGDGVADWQTAARYPYKALRYRAGKAASTGDVRKKWEGPLYPRPNRAAREGL
ncbi:hypothetical protein B0H14DRAFT_2654049 [Mycena olivaceomarginata]|nr:hypothetical protein B0H14DRAFT_2654049 [Mycena olivaceomarginata]